MGRHGGKLDRRKFIPLGKTHHFPAGSRITALLLYQPFGTKENIQVLILPAGKYSKVSLRKRLLLSHLDSESGSWHLRSTVTSSTDSSARGWLFRAGQGSEMTGPLSGLSQGHKACFSRGITPSPKSGRLLSWGDEQRACPDLKENPDTLHTP